MLSKAIEDLKKQIAIRPRYDDCIRGKWVAPVRGRYFNNVSPITGQKFCEVARSADTSSRASGVKPTR